MEKTATLELTEAQLKTLALWLPRVELKSFLHAPQHVTNQDKSVLGEITDKTYDAIARL